MDLLINKTKRTCEKDGLKEEVVTRDAPNVKKKQKKSQIRKY